MGKSCGLTGGQHFFLAFTQSWRRKMLGAALRSQIITEEHVAASTLAFPLPTFLERRPQNSAIHPKGRGHP
jgi:hypothetical protein